VKLTHLDEEGRPRMVDVGAKAMTVREAVAEGLVRMSADALRLVISGEGPKGEVLRTAELAGTMAAKQTGTLIPLCHPLPLDAIEVRVEPEAGLPGVRVTATVRATARTGVEMEALTAAAIACLTVYDMVKAADRGMTIDHVRLLRKSGGARGDWVRQDDGPEEE
jgi:cyclic pyranopterin phosphate synthase